jgi:DNA modification methylase
VDLPPYGDLGEVASAPGDPEGGGKRDAGADAGPALAQLRLFLFSKQPNYYFDRRAIDVASRSGRRTGDRANAGSVWETRCEILSDTADEPDSLWRVNSEASPYRHVAMWPRTLVRQMLLPTARPGDTVLDPFAGSGTTGEVALDLGLKAILIESSSLCTHALTDRLSSLNGKLPF